MKVKALQTFRRSDNRQIVRRGDEIDITEGYARQLEAQKMIAPTIGSKMKPARKEAADTASADPTASLQDGGPTGEEDAASSSAPARRRRTPASSAPEDEPASSPSTEAGSSRRGRTRSTAATSPGGKNIRASRRSRG